MKNNKKFALSTITMAISTVVIGSNAYGYVQGQSEYASVNQGEKIVKEDTLTAVIGRDGKPKLKAPVGSLLSEMNRAGNPVRIIWYGNPDDQDGKIPQKGAENNGYIFGKVTAQGVRTYDKDQKASEISIEGQANGIDALGWSAPSNTNSVEIDLTHIGNHGISVGEAVLRGGLAGVHGRVRSFLSANGVSLAATADFGRSLNVDGVSGASSTGGSASVGNSDSALDDDELDALISGTPSTEEAPKDTADVDMHGKNLKLLMNTIENTGVVSGKLTQQSFNGIINPPKDKYTPMFYGASSTAAGNGINVATYIDTPDRQTFSDDKTNVIGVGVIKNSGSLIGNAEVRSGQKVTHTNTKTIATANGVSVYAETGRNAKHSTSANIYDRVENNGRIYGHLVQVSANNSGFDSPHMSAVAESTSSGNGISVANEATNGQVKRVQTKINQIINQGSIHGDAYLKAGNGSGDLTVTAMSVGNGVSLRQSKGGSTASIGNIENSGMITGSIESRPGVVFSSVKAGKTIPEQEARLVITTKDNYRKSINNLPDIPAEAAEQNGYSQFSTFHANSTITASGNGISGIAGTGVVSDNTSATRLGDVNNTGVISGYAKLYHGYFKGYEPVNFLSVGSGIAVDRALGYMDNAHKRGNIMNAGIISGNHSAVLVPATINNGYSYSNPKFDSGYTAKLDNYGVMAGQMIAGQYRVGMGLGQHATQSYTYFEPEQDPIANHGIKVYLKQGIGLETKTVRTPNPWLVSGYSTSTKEVSVFKDNYEFIDRVVVGNGGTYQVNGKTYQIINAPLISDGKDSQQTFSSDIRQKIINGVGIQEGAAIAEKDLNIAESILNGYRTALYLKDDVNVKVIDSTFNANGFKINRTLAPYAIRGSEGTNTLTLGGNSVINGDIALAGGDDVLTIKDNSVKMNGNLVDLGTGNDTLSFGGEGSNATTQNPINVSYNINSAENLVVNNPTKISSQAKIQGTNNITLNDNLIYQVENETRHAFYANSQSPLRAANTAHKTSNLVVKGIGHFIVDIPDTLKKVNFGSLNLTPDSSATFKATNVLLDVIEKDGDLLITSPEDKKQAEEAAKLAKQQAEQAAAEAKRKEEEAKALAEAKRREEELARQAQLEKEKAAQELQNRLAAAEKNAEEALKAVQEMQRNALRELEEAKQKLQAALATQAQQSQALHQETVAKERALADFEAAQEKLRQALASQAQNRGEALQAQRAKEQALSDLKIAQDKLQQALEAQGEQAQATEREMQAKQQALTDLQAAQDKLQKVLEAQGEQAQATEREMQAKQQALTDLQAAQDRLQKALEAQGEQTQATEREMQAKQQALTDLQTAQDKLQKALDAQSENALTAERENQAKQHALAELESTKQKLTASEVARLAAQEKLKEATQNENKTQQNLTALSEMQRNKAFVAGTNAASTFLKESASLKNKGQDLTTAEGLAKAETAAQQAISDYLDQVQHKNIYGALPTFALESLQTYRSHHMNEAKLLADGDIKTSASLLVRQEDYKESADSAKSSGIMLGLDYAPNDNITLGTHLGSSKEKLNGHQGSYLKGDSVYVSGYIITGNNKFNLTTGIAYEKLNLKGKRNINNGYDAQSFETKLHPTIIGAYTQAKYAISLGENLSLEPKAGIAYNQLKLKKISEQGNGGLNVNKHSYNTIDTIVGQDLTLNIPTIGGRFSTKLSLDYIHTSGYKNLTAYFHNGTNDFAIYNEKNSNVLRVGTIAEYEWNTGVSVKAGIANTFRSSGNMFTGSVGVGYKF